MIAFNDQPPKVLIGQSGTVSVTTASAPDTLYIPSSAIHNGPNNTHTVQIHQQNKTTNRTIKTGIRGDTYTEIKSGLSTGEQVVTSG